MIGLIKRTFTCLNKDMFTKVYMALVRPQLHYDNVVWYLYSKRQSVGVERVQRKATRPLKDCKDISYAEKLKYLKSQSQKWRRLRRDLIGTHKFFNNLKT